MEFTNTTKFLVLDGQNIMRWDSSKNMYLKVDGESITPELIEAHGSNILPTNTTGLISPIPKVFAYDSNIGIIPTNISYRVLPVVQLVKMTTPIIFSAGYITSIKNVKCLCTLGADAILRFIVSPDSGVSWYTFNTSWVPIELAISEISAKGINYDALASITSEAWTTLFKTKSILFAWVMQTPNVDTQLVLNNIEITYNTK